VWECSIKEEQKMLSTIQYGQYLAILSAFFALHNWEKIEFKIYDIYN